MCGITGILRFDSAREPIDSALLDRMTDVLAHRGPDGRGTWHDEVCGLGHRRLAIVDVSEAGRQPMENEDGSLQLSFNGEIYGFRPLRASLEARGHVFASDTDCEVVLHAFEEWGTRAFELLDGQFAFALYEVNERRLHLVRDRIGIKPLFFQHDREALRFGSEVKAILVDRRVERRLDVEALAYFLGLNYTPAPWTLFDGIRQLEPGQRLEVEADGRVKTITWWRLGESETEHESGGSWRDDHEVFDDLLSDAVRRRLMSDVPFGAFLSGGVDSSTVVWWMDRHLNTPVRTFTIGFGDSDFDERRYAREVARTIGAEAYERTVEADAATILPTLVAHAEEPTADSSMVAVYHLAKLAREHVTMVLAGDGADEILAGYPTYPAYRLHQIARFLLPDALHGVVEAAVDLLPVSDGKVTWRHKVERFASGLHHDAEAAHATRRQIFDARARAALLEPLGADARTRADLIVLYRRAFAASRARHPVDRMLEVDTRLYLPNDMLVKVDRMSMAHGLEARVPFLDHRLVELCRDLPASRKLRWGARGKYLLKRSMRGRLPGVVLDRPKAGFNMPKARWIRRGMRPFVEDALGSSRLADMPFLAPMPVRRLLDEHFAGRADHSHKIWGLLTLSEWWRRFFRDGP
ncbi:MAG: asparagine synthase (glutamine-hydrolyzing) [Acidobacteriota bacterium]